MERLLEVENDLVLRSSTDGSCRAFGPKTAEVFKVPEIEGVEDRGFQAQVDGAIFVGFSRYSAAKVGKHTLLSYIAWLVANYYFAEATPRIFKRAAERFEGFGRKDLREFALLKAEEETGHHLLAERDLERLGLPVKEVLALLKPRGAEAFISFFEDCVESEEPQSCFGFSYCLERLSLNRNREYIDHIKKLCGKANATQFLVVHSGIGTDCEHVTETLNFIAELDEEDRHKVVRAAFRTALLLNEQPEMNASLSDEEILKRLTTVVSQQKLDELGLAAHSHDMHAA